MSKSISQESIMLSKGFLSPRKASELSGLAAGSISRAASEGRIRANRTGRYVYVSIHDFCRFLGDSGPMLLKEVLEHADPPVRLPKAEKDGKLSKPAAVAPPAFDEDDAPLGS